MKVEFHLPELPHPNSKDLTILELGQILEKKFHVIENFTKFIVDDFKSMLLSRFNERGVISRESAQEWLKNQWREYIISGRAGFTAASKERGDPAFVETSAYYLSVQPKFVFERDEVSLFN